MRYEVQQTECFCNCGQFFALLNSPRPPPPLLAPPPNSPKNKTLKKKKKKTPGDIIILHNCTKNHDHMLYCS